MESASKHPLIHLAPKKKSSTNQSPIFHPFDYLKPSPISSALLSFRGPSSQSTEPLDPRYIKPQSYHHPSHFSKKNMGLSYQNGENINGIIGRPAQLRNDHGYQTNHKSNSFMTKPKITFTYTNIQVLNDNGSQKKEREETWDLRSLENEKVIYMEPSISEKKLREDIQRGQIFNDQDFPPNDSSLYGQGYTGGVNRDIVWRRISEEMPDWQIFTNEINPRDIIQGLLGNCYFLAGLSALAERPSRIKDLFLSHKKNENYHFSMKMLYRGKWRVVDVDDWIPFYGNQPAFCNSRQKQLWVILLEKAWAKVYGSYKVTEGGFPEEVLHDLTGAPVLTILLPRPNSSLDWNQLLRVSLRQYPMVAGTYPGSDADVNQVGIYFSHAYTVLNAINLNTGQGYQKILQLRNPWGDKQYTGKWCDMDPLWDSISQEQKERVGFKKKRDDGIFFMPFDIFTKVFFSLYIALVNDNASYVYQSYWDPEKQGAFFTIDIYMKGEYWLQVDKTPRRAFTELPKHYRHRYPEAQLHLAKIQENKLIWFPTAADRKRTLYLGYYMTPGTYVAYVKKSGYNQFEQDFEVNLAVYSDYWCKVRLASSQEAVRLTGNPHINWDYGRQRYWQMQRGNQRQHKNSQIHRQWGNN